MKHLILSLLTFIAVAKATLAQTPVLGTYPNTTIATTGSNATITPSAQPANTLSATAYTSTVFKGLLHVNPATGKLSVTNASPAGTYTITIKAFNGTGSTTTTCVLTVNNSICGNLASTDQLSSGSNYVFATTLGDFNNDGISDLAVASNGIQGNVAIRPGTSTGSFGAAINLVAGSYISFISVGDFNGDGKQDLAIANNSSDSVTIRLGNGTGGFAAAPPVKVGASPRAMAIADFNGDGKPDLATANTTGSTVSIRLGNGDGTFSGTTNLPVPSAPLSLTVADFNGDGIPDFAVTSSYSTAVRLGDGTGNFSGTYSITTTSTASSVDNADFNGDGIPDLIAAYSNESLVAVRLGDGTGSFGSARNFVLKSRSGNLKINDFNGDGQLDFITQNVDSTLTIRYGDGTGNFREGSTLKMNGPPYSFVTSDFNADGKADIAVSSGYGANGAAIFIFQGNANEINVQGNGITIPTGSSAPSTGNFTDFGNAGRVTRTFTIQNTGAAPLTISSITISGADSAQFTPGSITLPAVVAPGVPLTPATFTITFLPASTGLKTATVNIRNDDCDESIYTFAVQGTGVVPAPVSYPATTIVAASKNAVVTPAAAPVNTTSLFLFASAGFKGQLQADPATGNVTITNAHPAGIYTITVRAFNGLLLTTSSFMLTVNSMPRCQAIFGGTTNVTNISGSLLSLVVADVNGDGKQDLTTANYNSPYATVFSGNGTGGIASSFNVYAGTNGATTSYPYYTAPADINGDGKVDLLIANGSSNNVAVRLGNSTGNFIDAANVSVGDSPRSLAVADFNGDGKPDMAVANYYGRNVSIRLGDGTGGFSSAMDVSVPGNPSSIVVSDFNGDGIPDWATATISSNNASVRLGNGTGGFSGTVEVPVGTNPQSIATGDFNGDGKPDIATANSGTNTVSVRFGDGAGNFTGTTEVSVGSLPMSVAVGDFNGDGFADLAAANNTSNTVSVRLGNGTGSFSGITEVPVSTKPQALAVGDFNGDGVQDLATTSYINSGSTVSIRLGSTNEINIQGNGQNIPDGNSVADTANFTGFGSTGDRKTRIFTIQNTGLENLTIGGITTSGTDASLFTIGGINFPAVIAGGSSATFTVYFQPTSTGQKTATINIVNDDCDEGLYDFAVAGTGVAVTHTLGSYPAATIATAGGSATVAPSAVPVGAVSLNVSASAGFKGILQADPVTGNVTITNAQPAGTYTITVMLGGIPAVASSFTLTVNNAFCGSGFGSQPNVSVSGSIYSLAIADFNKDGKPDFAVANNTNNAITVRLGTGTGGFTTVANTAVGTAPRSVAVADFNGDGKPDIAAANNGSNTVSIRLGDGTGAFTGTTNVAVGNGPWSVVVADFNNDGKPDFATANRTDNTVSVRLGDGAGNFSGSTTVNTGTQPQSIATGDFNSDGNLDMAIANYGSNVVSIRLGDGAGNFSGANNVSVGSGGYEITTADFNRDGRPDLAVANYSSNTVSIRLGNGAGGFTGTTDVAIGGNGIYAIATGDFNGDGNPDLAIPVYFGYLVSIRYGNGMGGFNGITNIATAQSQSPEAIAVADFNADGKSDFATLTSFNGVVFIRTGSTNEIGVQGNGMAIADGTNTADTAHFTAFGSILADSTATRTFTIQNTGVANLTIGDIFLSGTDSLQFIRRGITLPATIAPGASATFTISFEPTVAGFKTARVNIVNDDCDEAVYDFVINGSAVCTAITANNVWIGTTSGWDTPGNWSLGVVPNGCSRVVVNAGVPFMPQISTAASCYSLTLNNGATFTVTGTGSLAITGP